MNTAIYTIAKNEAHNVAAFMDAAQGAPVYVLDTGSTDDTVELLKKHGANVKQQIVTPWRFDTARNIALDMVPRNVDVCVSLDMDEVIENNWQEKLKKEQDGNIGNYVYIAEWRDKEKTIPAVTVPRTRIHARHGFEWKRKIHEIIKPLPNVEEKPFNTSILVKHYQDDKQRNYSFALDEIISEYPLDADARLQRGGERYAKQEWAKALEDYKEYLKILADDDTLVIRNRKANVWVAIACCYNKLGKMDESFRAFISAVAADPGSREAWVHLAHTLSQINNVPLAYGAAMTANSIKKPYSFAAVDGYCWSDYPKELADNMFGKLIGGK